MSLSSWLTFTLYQLFKGNAGENFCQVDSFFCILPCPVLTQTQTYHTQLCLSVFSSAKGQCFRSKTTPEPPCFFYSMKFKLSSLMLWNSCIPFLHPPTIFSLSYSLQSLLLSWKKQRHLRGILWLDLLCIWWILLKNSKSAGRKNLNKQMFSTILTLKCIVKAKRGIVQSCLTGWWCGSF